MKAPNLILKEILGIDVPFKTLQLSLPHTYTQLGYSYGVLFLYTKEPYSKEFLRKFRELYKEFKILLIAVHDVKYNSESTYYSILFKDGIKITGVFNLQYTRIKHALFHIKPIFHNKPFSLNKLEKAFSKEYILEQLLKDVTQWVNHVKKHVDTVYLNERGIKIFEILYQTIFLKILSDTDPNIFELINKNNYNNDFKQSKLKNLWFKTIFQNIVFTSLNGKQDFLYTEYLPKSKYLTYLTSIKKYEGLTFVPEVEDFYQEEKLHSSKFLDNFFFSDAPKGILSILENYSCTHKESYEYTYSLEISPEVISKIHEKIFLVDDTVVRKNKSKVTSENINNDLNNLGSIYTPKEIVHYITVETLKEFFIENCQEIPNLEKRLDILLEIDNTQNPFNPTETLKLKETLKNLKVLDPCTGTGNFIIGYYTIVNNLINCLNKH